MESMMREEIQQFLMASEQLLDLSVEADELSYVEREALWVYLSTIAEKFPVRPDN